MSVGLLSAEIAREWLGTPYRHQASTLGAGCDCLGLVRGVWRALYGEEPESMPFYAIDPRRDVNPDELQRAAAQHLRHHAGEPRIGDVILFQLRKDFPPRHCGILVSPNSFIHAQERLGVVEAPLADAWRRRIFDVYAFPEKGP